MSVPEPEPYPAPAPQPMGREAYLAFLEQLPPAASAQAVAVAAPVAVVPAQQDSEDADEDYVPPPSAREHSHHHHHHHEKHERHEKHARHGHSQGGAARGCNGGGNGGANARRRGIQGSLGVTSGRVQKHEHAQRHHYSHRHEEEGEDGIGEQAAARGGGAIGRSQSAAADMRHGGKLRNGIAGAGTAYHRSFSSPANPSGGASLGGLLTATKLFGPILGALSGPAGAAHPATAAMAAAAAAAGTSSGGQQLAGSPSKRGLFGATWSGGSSSSAFHPPSLNGYGSGSSARHR